MMNKNELKERGLIAAKKFLIAKDYEILDDNLESSIFDLVIRNNDIIAFVKVSTRESSETGFPEDWFSRCACEREAEKWLIRNTNDNDPTFRVRFDSISLLVLSEHRAFLRHHLNVNASEEIAS